MARKCHVSSYRHMLYPGGRLRAVVLEKGTVQISILHLRSPTTKGGTWLVLSQGQLWTPSHPMSQLVGLFWWNPGPHITRQTTAESHLSLHLGFIFLWPSLIQLKSTWRRDRVPCPLE